MTESGNDWHVPIEDLSAFADGEFLSPSERAAIEQHLDVCDVCREEFESLQAVSQLLAELPEPELPRSFRLSPEDVRPVVPADASPIQPWILRHQTLFQYAGLAAALLLVVLVAVDLTSDDDTDEAGELFTTMQEADEEAPEHADEPGVMTTDDREAVLEAPEDMDEAAPEEEAAEEAAPEEDAVDDPVAEEAPDVEADAEDHPVADSGAEESDHPVAEEDPAQDVEDPEFATRTAAEQQDEGLSMLQVAAVVAGVLAVSLLMLGFVIPRWWSASDRAR